MGGTRLRAWLTGSASTVASAKTSTSGRRTRGCAETLRCKGEDKRWKRRSADKGRGRCIANHGPLSSPRSRSLSGVAAAFRDRVSIALRRNTRVLRCRVLKAIHQIRLPSYMPRTQCGSQFLISFGTFACRLPSTSSPESAVINQKFSTLRLASLAD